MKNLIVILSLLMSVQVMLAQNCGCNSDSSNVYCEGFNLNGGSHAICDGVYPRWININGTADNNDNGKISMYVNRIQCPYGSFPTDVTESIALEYDFEAGKEYTICYELEASPTPHYWMSSTWILTNDIDEGCGGQSHICVDGEVGTITPIPSGSEELIPDLWSDQIISRTQTFTVESDFSKLWLRNILVPLGSGWQETTSFVHLHNFCISASETTSPIVNGHLESSSGQETSVFCYGEDIILDGSLSNNYDEYWIAVERLDAAGNPQNWIGVQGWMSAPINTFNLTDYNNYQGDVDEFFCPGFDYRIQFALKNECDPWESIHIPFSVECCDDTFDPSFRLDQLDAGSGNGTIRPSNYNTYSDISSCGGVQHSWCVLSSEHENGPYEIEEEYTGEYFEFTAAEPGIYYTVIHTLSTPCGDFCYGWNTGHGLSRTSVTCELCGPIDCPTDCIPTEPCETPVIVGCTTIENYLNLDWEDVGGALGYEIEVTHNDPACCDNGVPPTVMIVRTEGSSYEGLIFPTQTRCWSWRVRAVCSNGESTWSEKYCFNSEGCGPAEKEKEIGLRGSENGEIGGLSIYPNPFSDQLTISLKRGFPLGGLLTIVDVNGKEVISGVMNPFEKEMNVQTNRIPSGIYHVRLTDVSGGVILTELIVKQ